MKTFAFATVMIASCFAAACVSIAAEGSGPDETAKKQIRQIEQEWVDALVKRDIAWFERSIADDWEMLLPNGKTEDKKEFLKPLKDGSLTVEKYQILELDVRVWDNTAVVIGHGIIQGKNKDKVIDHQECWSDVYVKKDGRWLCVSATLVVTKKK